MFPWKHSQTPVTVEPHAWQEVFLILRRVYLCFWCSPKSCFPSLSFCPRCSLDWLFFGSIYQFILISLHCCFQLNLVLTAAQVSMPMIHSWIHLGIHMSELYSAIGHGSFLRSLSSSFLWNARSGAFFIYLHFFFILVVTKKSSHLKSCISNK